MSWGEGNGPLTFIIFKTFFFVIERIFHVFGINNISTSRKPEYNICTKPVFNNEDDETIV